MRQILASFLQEFVKTMAKISRQMNRSQKLKRENTVNRILAILV